MSKLGVHKGKRQGDWCVTYYALGKEPINDMHGFFINVGTYDTEAEAEKDAKRIRLELKNIGGRVRVHMTGHAEALLGDDAKYASNKKLVSDDVNSMHSIKQQEDHAKRIAEKKQIEERRKAVEDEEKMYEDPNSIESYAQLHIRRRMMEETMVAQEQSVKMAQQKMAELKAEITERDVATPDYKDQWRKLIIDKIGTDKVFILQERTDPNAPAVDIEEEFQRVVESGAPQAVAQAEASSSSEASPALEPITE
jgi:hypothetical protein